MLKFWIPTTRFKLLAPPKPMVKAGRSGPVPFPHHDSTFFPCLIVTNSMPRPWVQRIISNVSIILKDTLLFFPPTLLFFPPGPGLCFFLPPLCFFFPLPCFFVPLLCLFVPPLCFCIPPVFSCGHQSVLWHTSFCLEGFKFPRDPPSLFSR